MELSNENVDFLLTKAVKLYESCDYAGSLKCYHEILEHNKECCLAWVGLGNVMNKLNIHGDAIYCCGIANKLALNNWEKEEVSKLLSELGFDDDDLLDDFVVSYNIKLNELNDNLKKYNEIKMEAIRLFFNKNYRKSKILFNRCLRIFNDDFEVLRFLSANYLALNDFKKAIFYVDKSIEINNNYIEAWMLKSSICLISCNWQDALDSIDVLIEYDSSNYNFWLMKAYAFIGLNDWNKVLYNVEMAISLNKSDSNSWAVKGYAFYNLNNFSEANECFNKSLLINPNNQLAKEIVFK